MNALRVAIVDDEPPARRKLRRLLERVAEAEIVGEAGSGGEATRLLQDTRPDLVFLDVQMPDMDGFSVLEQLDRPEHMQVVFVTAFDQHALRAFEVHALDYLLKPVSPARFEEAVERARGRVVLTDERLAALVRRLDSRSHGLRRISLDVGDRIVFLAPDDIDYVEAAGNYVLVHAGPATHHIRGTLEAFAKRLAAECFPRINRSQVVNVDRIRELRPWFHGDYRAILANGCELSWSRRYSPKSHLARLQSR